MIVEWNYGTANQEHPPVRGDKEKGNVKHAALAGVAEGKHPSRHRCNRSGGEAAHIEEEIKWR